MLPYSRSIAVIKIFGNEKLREITLQATSCEHGLQFPPPLTTPFLTFLLENNWDSYGKMFISGDSFSFNKILISGDAIKKSYADNAIWERL